MRKKRCSDCVHYECCQEKFTDLGEDFDQKIGLTEEQAEHCNQFFPAVRRPLIPCEVGKSMFFIMVDEVYQGTCVSVTIDTRVHVHIHGHEGDHVVCPDYNVFTSHREAEKELDNRRKGTSPYSFDYKKY